MHHQGEVTVGSPLLLCEFASSNTFPLLYSGQQGAVDGVQIGYVDGLRKWMKLVLLKSFG